MLNNILYPIKLVYLKQIWWFSMGFWQHKLPLKNFLFKEASISEINERVLQKPSCNLLYNCSTSRSNIYEINTRKNIDWQKVLCDLNVSSFFIENEWKFKYILLPRELKWKMIFCNCHELYKWVFSWSYTTKVIDCLLFIFISK